jgi:ribosomal protein S18 acetylase RimI-like enzyme
MIGVAPEFQGKGAGRALFEIVFKEVIHNIYRIYQN